MNPASVHAGVNLNMHSELRIGDCVYQPLCQLPIVNRRCQLIGYYCLRQFWERTEQDENRLADAGIAQFSPLFYRGDSEHIGDFVQCLCDANRAVSVSICLDNGDETGAGMCFNCFRVRSNRR